MCSSDLHLHKCPVTVEEYSSIFFHRSLLTLIHLRNFTLQVLRSSSDWGLSWSEAWILRPVADPPTLWCRRFLSPAGPEVARPGHPGSSSLAWSSRRFLGLAAFSRHPRTREGRRFPPFFARGPPPVSQSLHTLCTTRRVVNIKIGRASCRERV